MTLQVDQPRVFVTLGDITHLACDAWLLPTDQYGTVNRSWAAAVPELAGRIEASLSDGFRRGEVLAAPVSEWPDGLPLPVLTAVPLHGVDDRNVRELGVGLREFVHAAGAAVPAGESAGAKRRGRRLFAVPFFGTGQGGGGRLRGLILDQLLERAGEAATESDVDIVLVVREPQTFALAQRKRRDRVLAELPGQWHEAVTALAEQARRGKLVLFMGSGISISAGAPSWARLIATLAGQVGISGAELDKLQQRDVLDQATIVGARFREQGKDFGTAIADAVNLTRYGLAPALLASLGTPQAITLNYDRLFEIASGDAGSRRTIIPSEHSATTGDWLLKLHGSAERPESIVLSRADYLGYSANREALSAIVKANLITHHLLFVGFGFADDHFFRILHDVQRALPDSTGERGTALTLEIKEFDEALWGKQIRMIPMADRGREQERDQTEQEQRGDADPVRGGRRLEVVLDALACAATDAHGYLLDDDFASALQPEEMLLRERLLALRDGVSAAERRLPAWAVVARMLTDLGASAEAQGADARAAGAQAREAQ